MARKIEVVPYDPAWPGIFRQEAEIIQVILGANLINLHHVGSTAIPDLAAKPTIDMLIEVNNLATLDACNPTMVQIGYLPKGENGIPGRRYFQKLAGEMHLFHIHAFEKGHPDLARHLAFRDYLRAHPHEARAYQGMKQGLAARFPYEPQAYTSGKTDFIQAMNQRASAWRLLRDSKAPPPSSVDDLSS